MQHTTNLNLKKPELTDVADILALNENWDTLDGEVSNKVDKEIGKVLSTNDYTDVEKTKLAGLSNYDSTNVDNHIANVSNPHSVTAVQVGAAPSSHTGETNNPHGVTAGQINIIDTNNIIDSTTVNNALLENAMSRFAFSAGGTANTLTINTNGAWGALTDGKIIKFRALSNNTGATTLQIDSNTAKVIKDETNADLAADALIAGQMYEVWYNATSGFFTLRPKGGIASIIKSIQRGQTSVGANGTQYVTISSINTSNSIIIANWTGTDHYQPSPGVAASIYTSTMIKIDRSGAYSTKTVKVDWQVLEFEDSIIDRIQKGTFSYTGSADYYDVLISSVDLTKSMLFFTASYSLDHGGRVPSGGFQTNNTLRFNGYDSPGSAVIRVAWFVVQFK